MSNDRKRCINCNTIYIGSGYKKACTKECHNKKEYSIAMEKSGRFGKKHKVKIKPVHLKICDTCGEEFESNRKNSRACSFGCSLGATRQTQDEKISKANARWLNPIPRKPNPKRKSYSQLNREAEWRRVWDDESWTRNYRSYRG